jgi:hypothetical protein
MDEKALSMMVMLQDVSRYIEGSRGGKVLLFKGKENRKRATCLPRQQKSSEVEHMSIIGSAHQLLVIKPPETKQ